MQSGLHPAPLHIWVFALLEVVQSGSDFRLPSELWSGRCTGFAVETLPRIRFSGPWELKAAVMLSWMIAA